MPAEGDKVGPYRLVRVLGRGGMGVVYEALDERVGRSVALKVLDAGPLGTDDALGRFEREARVAANLHHPNVIVLYDVIVDGPTHAIVLELVPGGSLRERLKREGRIPWREAARLGAKIAEGLAAIHAAGLIHRDLKPANVLIDARGEPRVGDFGLARFTAFSSSLSKTGQVVGTLEYLAPELSEGGAGVGPAVDLYALGASLHQMLAGEVPFAGTGYGLIIKHLREEPPSVRKTVPEVPEPFAQLVLRLLSKEPAARGRDASSVARELEAIAVGPEKAEPPPRRGVPVVALIAIAGLASAIALSILAWSGPPAPPAPPPPVELAIDEPAPDAPVAAERVIVRGRATGARTVTGADGQVVPVGESGDFFFEAPVVSGTVTVRAAGAARSISATVHVWRVPEWFFQLPEGARPRLPLPGELRFSPTTPKEYVNGKDDSVLVHVPAATFSMGSDLDETKVWGPYARTSPYAVDPEVRHASPPHDVTLSGFFIGKCEVSVGQYHASRPPAQRSPVLRAGLIHNGHVWEEHEKVSWRDPEGYPRTKAEDDEPVTQVTWYEAKDYCEWAGLTLPTEAQWEKAALWDPATGKRRHFPWGDDPPGVNGPRGNFRDRSFAKFNENLVHKPMENVFPFDDRHHHRAPVGQTLTDCSAYGVLDMAGNVQEWVADHFAPYSADRARDPLVTNGTGKVVRGSGWADYVSFAPTAGRRGVPPRETRNDRGFRVALRERE